MKTSEKKNILKLNTLLWLAAMVLPVLFSFAFASTRFPWQLVLPFLLVGPMLASNKLLNNALGETANQTTPQQPKAS